MLNIIKKVSKYLLISILVIGIIAVIIIHVLGNFYKVDDNVFRSGQLNKYNLEYYAKKHEIKTILNLRGQSKKPEYLDEVAIADKYNMDYITYKMSNKKFYDLEKTSELINIIRESKKPILIHCAGGADRTSLASALYQYAIANKSVTVAKEEFSLLYGHAPFIRKHVKAMGDSFDNYVLKISEKESKK